MVQFLVWNPLFSLQKVRILVQILEAISMETMLVRAGRDQLVHIVKNWVILLKNATICMGFLQVLSSRAKVQWLIKFHQIRILFLFKIILVLATIGLNQFSWHLTKYTSLRKWDSHGQCSFIFFYCCYGKYSHFSS